MKKIITGFVSLLCSLGLSISFAEELKYFPEAPILPKTIVREFKYFQPGNTFDLKKGKQINVLGMFCNENETCDIDLTTDEKNKLKKLVTALSQKKYQQASDVYYKDFLSKLDNLIFRSNSFIIQLYVRPYKNGIIVLTAAGQDGAGYVLNYVSLNNKGQLQTYSNMLYTRDKEYAGFKRIDDNLIYLSYAHADFYTQKEKYGTSYKELTYEFIKEHQKTIIQWFKRINLKEFLDFNNKKYYWKVTLN